MTALLTDNLPLLAGAPNGIKKLRELILELAVRGKLLPQISDEEPASELLKRIAKEKTLLEVRGQIRKQKPLPHITEEEQLFELPAGWAWARLADIAFSQAGFAFKSNGFNQAGLGFPLIRIRDVGQAISGTYYEGDYRPEFLVQRGDYIISMDGEFRVAAWEGEASLLNQRVSRLIFFGAEVAQRFIADSLQARLLELQGIKAYTTVDHLSGGQISESVIALPPLGEQRRIVAKVDELMALCDRLEARQADAESAHAQLVQALLDSLTQARDAADFATNWQRLAEHFHTLFTTEPSIDALKQTLLQLAVMGKLVPQDASDEPASELLKCIAEAKVRLIAEGKIKKPKPLAEIAEVEKSFELPENWEWVRLEEIAQVGTGATPLRTNPKYFEPATINWVTSGETSQDHIHETEQKVSPLALTETNLTVYPPHTLVIAMYGQGKTRGQISELLIDACTNQACAAIQLFDQDESHRRYVKYFFVKSYDDIRLLAAGGAQPNLNLGKIKETVLPLPPATEQHRIVAKVDQLMALCDQLKTRLTQARQLNEQLASTLVERAVA